MSNLLQRLISGAVYVALVIASIHFGNPWFTALIALLCLLSLMEVIQLTQKHRNSSTSLTALVYAGLIVYLNLFEQVDTKKFEYLVFIGGAVQVAVIYLMYRNFKEGKMPALLFTTLYIWLPLISLSLWFTQHTEQAFEWGLLFFVSVWANDSFAYSVGMLMGKNKIFPKVSPNKTIEGTIGGLVLTAVGVYFLNDLVLHLPVTAVAVSFVVAIASIFGDFFQSFFKRQLGIKDSGNLIPGHGGVLDRLDSILFAAIPFVVLLILYY